jgi:hypothetical protein
VCNDIERRFVFHKQHDEEQGGAAPVLPASLISPAAVIQCQPASAQRFFKRGVARLYSQLRAVVSRLGARDMRVRFAAEAPKREDDAKNASQSLQRNSVPPSNATADFDQVLSDWPVSKSNRNQENRQNVTSEGGRHLLQRRARVF